MNTEFRLRPLGSAQEVTIGRWLKKSGDPVTAGEKLLEVSSDTADWDIPAPVDGTLQAIESPAGAHVSANAVLASIATSEPAAPAPAQASPALEAQMSPSATPVPAAPRISPLAARIAMEEGVDLSQISGTGVDGRVTKEDVLAFKGRQPAPSAAAAPPADGLLERSPQAQAAFAQATQSKQSVPHVSTFVEIDMTSVVRQREALCEVWQRREGFDADHLPFVVLAAISALREVPVVNGLFAPNGILLRNDFHIAVDIPALAHSHSFTLRDAEIYNLLGIARRLQLLDSSSSAQPDGTTFAIEDRTAGGALLSTAIIRPGHSARLVMGAIQPRAVAADTGMRIRTLAWFSLTYDHRLVDGIVAGRFLTAFKQQLESACFR